MDFSDVIKSIRRKSLLSQAEFAKELGVSFSTINRWENGKAVPQLCKLKKLNAFCIAHAIPFDVEKFAINSGNNANETE